MNYACDISAVAPVDNAENISQMIQIFWLTSSSGCKDVILVMNIMQCFIVHREWMAWENTDFEPGTSKAVTSLGGGAQVVLVRIWSDVIYQCEVWKTNKLRDVFIVWATVWLGEAVPVSKCPIAYWAFVIVLLHDECLTYDLLAEQNPGCSHFPYIELYQAGASPD